MEIDSVAGKAVESKKTGKEEEEQDLYLKMKELENKLEIIDIQEEYIKDELRHLQSELVRSKEEVSFQNLVNPVTCVDPANPKCAPRNRELRRNG